jgi:uncharacterized membrane protein
MTIPEQPELALAESRMESGADRRGYRLTSIDMARGLVVVIMALDHVRDFVMLDGIQDPMSDPHISPPLFFTRWITHFCAPVFVYLAGTSAGLMAARRRPASLAAFLVTRGVWLILIEIFVVSTAFTFSPLGINQLGGRTMLILQVLWAIGAGMALLAGAQFLGKGVCFVIGSVIVLGHNLLDGVWPTSTGILDTSPPLWAALHIQMTVATGRFLIRLGYPLLPWAGVMLLGYGSAGIFQQPPEKRNSKLLRIGSALVAAFVVMRSFDIYGDPRGWHSQSPGITATVMSFLNTTKYPPSLLFLLMTLGPAAVLCAYAERFGGWLKDTLVMFGRVPFAFYIAHFYVAHTLAVVLGICQGYTVSQMMTYHRFTPKGFGVDLAGVYVVWLLVIALVYPLCRWFAAIKARRTDWWLSYV